MAPRRDTPEEEALERIRVAGSSRSPDLSLSHLGLPRVPPEIAALTHLQTLSLGYNLLRAIPSAITHLPVLSFLDLRGNALTALPSLTGLRRLKTLYLDDNSFAEVPPALCDLRGLEHLGLSNNRLSQLPPTLGNLTNLLVLALADNYIELLPSELAHLAKLQELELARNPLREPLPTLQKAGLSDLIAYLASLDDAAPQYEAKLILIGEGEVGKSSLIAALNHEPFTANRDSTHGIEMTPLQIEHPTLRVEMLLNAWDFGGQEIYRITHQFFFTRRALYLIVWKPRQGQTENAIDDWCRRISLRVGGDAKILVVSTHASQRAAELDYPLLRARFGEVLVGNHSVDSADGFGVAKLRDAISRYASELPQMGEPVSASWQSARAELLDLQEAQISYERFAAICGTHGLDRDATRALARMLHNLGHVIYYDEDDGLRDVVVLQPEWLTKAISYILEDAETRGARGVLDHHRLPEIWRSGQTGGYAARDHPFFLRLMEKFDVSYRIPETQASLVGQLVPYERPRIPWKEGERTRTLSLRCDLSEPVDGLISWLTVRHHRFSTGVHWRRGMFLEHREWGSQALLEMLDRERLTLTVSGPSPDAFFSILRDGIEHLIAQRWEGLGYELLVPCPSTRDHASPSPCQESFNFRHLLSEREEGGSRIRCRECRTWFDVGEMLTGFALPGGSLHGELQAIQERLADVSADVIDIKAVVSDSARQVRRVLRAISAEVTECPRLFSLVPVAPRGPGALRFWDTQARLTLWCEHADHEHPWADATYEVTQSRDWAIQLAPYAALVVKTLQVIAPVGVAALGVSMSDKEFLGITNELDLMKAVVERLPQPASRAEAHASNEGRLTTAEGSGLRALRALLAEKDKAGVFGGLRRRQTPAGDFVWICPEHMLEYDPGLPMLPGGRA